ncbi:MAG: hypothetical protein KKA90_04475 [Nanoarchaeota archaeon]|nr:hypothetical protein [Nanoarchaeota archaeon]
MKLFHALLVVSVLAVSMANPVAAQELEYFSIEDTINDDLSVSNELVLNFARPVTQLEYAFAFEITNLSVKADFASADCTNFPIEGKSTISCRFNGMTEKNSTLILSFLTENAVLKTDDGFVFSVNHGISVPIERSFVLIRLPENGILVKEPANLSYFPPSGNILSDGRRIMIFWEGYNLSSGDSLQFSVLYSTPFIGTLSDTYILAAALLAVVAMIGASVYIRRGQTKRVKVVTSVLSGDEKTIVSILEKHGGNALQKVLVRESNFSKAKISRLMKELKKRGVIGIEPVSGRENKVKLLIHDREKKETPKPEARKEEPKRPLLTPGEPAEKETSEES